MMYIKLNAIVPADDCYDDNNRNYVNSTILRSDSILGASVSRNGYVYLRITSGDDLRVEVHNSLCENAEDYSNIIMRRLVEVSN